MVILLINLSICYNKSMETTKQKITTPQAIIAAGFLIMLGIIFTNYSGQDKVKNKTFSEQVGISKEELKECLEKKDVQKLLEDTSNSADLAMKHLPQTERGTPYSVIIGKNGVKTEIRGAESIENVKKLIEEVKSGKVTNEYKGEIPAVTENDHIIGEINASVVIVEYSDLECPYCKRFGEVMKQIIKEGDGEIAWVYRHWVVHQGAIAKTVAAECVNDIKGGNAFFKYIDLIFGLMKTEQESVEDKL